MDLQPRIVVYDAPPSSPGHTPTTNFPVFEDQGNNNNIASSSCFPSTGSISYGKLNVVVPKRRYSHYRNDSLAILPLPTYQKSEQKKKKTPSSPTTVLAMSGLLCVGIMLMTSGIILLLHHFEQQFKITGIVFLCIGSLMLAVCAILQRKNFLNLLIDMKSDIYFWRPDDSYGIGLLDD